VICRIFFFHIFEFLMDELSSLIGNVRSDFGNPFQMVNDLTCGLKESVASIVWQ
jgi:hypothetical protein